MPHFENLDQYEAKNPKSGAKEIIPIAPHSLQAADYRPRKRAHAARKEADTLPPFKEVEIEPVSVEQMEREFRLANRQLKRGSSRRSAKSLKQRLLNWLKGLFKGNKGRSGKPSHGRRRREGGSGGPERKGPQSRQRPKGQPPAQGGEKSGAKRRRRRSRGARPSNQSGGPGGGQSGGPGGQSGGQEKSHSGKGRKRNRRNRGHGGKPGHPGDKGSGNSK